MSLRSLIFVAILSVGGFTNLANAQGYYRRPVANQYHRVRPICQTVQPRVSHLVTVPAGSTLTLPTNHLGEHAGSVFMVFQNIKLPVEIKEWKNNQITLSLPSMAIRHAVEVRLDIILANGHLAHSQKLRIVKPPQIVLHPVVPAPQLPTQIALRQPVRISTPEQVRPAIVPSIQQAVPTIRQTTLQQEIHVSPSVKSPIQIARPNASQPLPLSIPTNEANVETLTPNQNQTEVPNGGIIVHTDVASENTEANALPEAANRLLEETANSDLLRVSPQTPADAIAPANNGGIIIEAAPGEVKKESTATLSADVEELIQEAIEGESQQEDQPQADSTQTSVANPLVVLWKSFGGN